MATFSSETNIIKMTNEFFIDNDFTESHDKFERGFYLFINEIKNLRGFDITSNWTIQLPSILTHQRHRLHTFAKTGFIDFYSIGDSIKGKRIMIIEPSQAYIKHIIKNRKIIIKPLNNSPVSDKCLKQIKLEKLIEDEIALFKESLFSKIGLILNFEQ